MELAKKEIVIPALTLKSGVFRYKKKIEQRQKTQVVTASKESPLYPVVKSSTQSNDGNCYLVYEEGSSKIYFKIPDQKLSKKTGEIKYTMLACADISAADLKVTSKFGGWDTMTCRLVTECTNPLTAWQTTYIKELISENRNREDDGEILKELLKDETSPQNYSPSQTGYIVLQQESCMVKATFDIDHLKTIRDVLHSVKVANLKERKSMNEKHKASINKQLPIPTKIREGLPEWVHYIPAKWYSSTVRKVIEYVLILYTMLTLMWAVWQLYKHVDFIQRYLQPILDFIEFYLEVLKKWFRWLDRFTEALTAYWWIYMKPVYLLASPLYVALASLFKPLRNIAGVISSICEPIVKFFNAIISVLKPLLQPAIAVLRLFVDSVRKFFGMFSVLWNMFLNTAIIKLLIERSNQMGLSRVIHEITHRGLDPFTAQVVVIRDLLIRSLKQIFYGAKFLFTRIYFMFVFVKREQAYAREERETVLAEKEKAE